MKIPYGESNFKKVREQGFVYVDKTQYIAALENGGSHHFLLRPRRFGKSLFVSMLEYYYDCNHIDDFDKLFGDLSIGQNPTPLRNSYQVLFMEFTGIETESGAERVYQDFDLNVLNALKSFLERYDYPVSTVSEIEQEATPHGRMRVFFRIIVDQKILLLIDEYDHFANAILAEDLKLFQKIVGKGGFVRSFYEVLKTATQRGVLDRLFVTGVTPLMLDSMTSGFNISENLSLKKTFNEAVGFTREEVKGLVQPLVDQCSNLETEQLLNDMTAWYNGYRFHVDAAESTYNANMALYFIKNFDLEQCQYPELMLDENIASDYGKLMKLFSIGDRDENFKVLDELINGGKTIATQRRKFDFDKGFDRDDFVSLLGYMGFATVIDRTFVGQVFAIPNYVISELYFHYFKVELERRHNITISSRNVLLAVEALALRNDMQPLKDELKQVLQLLSNRDAMQFDEQHIKSILLTLLYQSPVYFLQSEREMNHKYPDVMLMERSPFKVQYQHLIELKYAKKGSGERGWASKREEGIQQVKGYLELSDIQALPKLSAWVILADGERVEVVGVAR